jgi:hypothetical protein
VVGVCKSSRRASTWLPTLLVVLGLVSIVPSCLTSGVLDDTSHKRGNGPRVKSILVATATEHALRIGLQDDHGVRSVYRVALDGAASIAMYECSLDSSEGARTFTETSSRRIELSDAGRVIEPRPQPSAAGEEARTISAAPSNAFDPGSPIAIRNDGGRIAVSDLTHPEATRTFELYPDYDVNAGPDVMLRVVMLPFAFALDVITSPFQLIYAVFLYPD